MFIFFLFQTIPYAFTLTLFSTINSQDETKWPWPDGCDSKIILEFKLFKFDDLTKGENILTKIKTRINEELKKTSIDLTFFTDFVKIDINYVILHPPDSKEKMMEAYYKERDRY